MSINLYCTDPNGREIYLIQTPDKVTYHCLAADNWSGTLERYLEWVEEKRVQYVEYVNVKYRRSNRGRNMPDFIEAKETEWYADHVKELRDAVTQYGYLKFDSV